MRKRSSLAAGLLGVALSAGCSRALDRAAARQPVPDYPVIGRLVARDRTITVLSSPDGMVYSVQTSDGTVLIQNASPAEFEAELPSLYQKWKDAAAADAALASPAAELFAD